MDYTLKYVIDKEFSSPFDFFQEFGDYWEDMGWQKIGHQLEDLFTRIHRFLTFRGTQNMDIVEGLMKLDYFLNHKYKPRKLWWDYSIDKKELARYISLVADRPEKISENFAKMKIHEKDLHKHASFEILSFDLSRLIETGEIERSTETLLIIYFPLDTLSRAEYYTLKLDKIPTSQRIMS